MTIGRRLFGFAVPAILLLSGWATPGRAEINVGGTLKAVRVTADRAAISDVLAAFARAFAVRYRASAPLDATVSGTYSGPFGKVISRLLDGYNYVIRNDGETIEIIVLSRHGERPVPAQTPPVPSAKGVASQWR